MDDYKEGLSASEQKDCERIENEDYLFGIGTTVENILEDQLKEASDGASFSFFYLDKGETAQYKGNLEALRVICKNEKMLLVATKYYLPVSGSSEYIVAPNYRLVLVKKLDIDEDDFKNSKKQIIKLIKIKNCFQDEKATIKDIFYFFFFPEKVLINEKGVGICDVICETDLEYKERLEEHDNE